MRVRQPLPEFVGLGVPSIVPAGTLSERHSTSRETLLRIESVARLVAVLVWVDIGKELTQTEGVW